MAKLDDAALAAMTIEQLIENIRNAKPDAKDIQRAESIYIKKPSSAYERECLANRQLRAITDADKFYRRIHAFLMNGINCSLNATMFYNFNQRSKEFIKTSMEIGKSNRAVLKAIDSL